MKFCMTISVLCFVFALLAVSSYAFCRFIPKLNINPCVYNNLRAIEEIDPTYEENLPNLLRAGMRERPSPDLPRELRKQYTEKRKLCTSGDMGDVDSFASNSTRKFSQNGSLETECDPTYEEFLPKMLKVGQKDRPSPDLPRELRKQFEKKGN